MRRMSINGKRVDPRLRKRERKQQRSVALPESLWKEVKVRALEWGVPMAGIIEQAIRDYLDRNHG